MAQERKYRLSNPDSEKYEEIGSDRRQLDEVPDHHQWGNEKILKNLAVMGLCSCLLSTGSNMVQKLQSSINLRKGLGTASLSVQTTTNMLGAIFVNTYAVKRIGTKNALMLCIFINCLYVAANLYASWYTLIPASAFVGVSFGVIYCAMHTYVSHLASQYSTLKKTDRSVVVSKFFGISSMSFQFAGVLGGIVSYYSLKPTKSDVEKETNNSEILCGKGFCDNQVQPASSQFTVSQEKIYLLCGILTAITATALILLWLFLERMDGEQTEKPTFCSALRLLARRQRNIFHILLIPITVYSGLQLSFIQADFTKAYITCSSSVEYVGLVLITYSLSDSISSLLMGQLVQLTGRGGVFLLAAIIDFSLIITMLYWTPDPDTQYVLYIIAGVWGIADGVWQGQVKATYSSLFPDHKEPAFSLLGAWENVGSTAGFAYSSYFCTEAKLYILMAVLLIGMTGYIAAEITLRRRITAG